MNQKTTSGTCKACGTTFAGVNETEYDRMFASHVLNEHGDEAPESVLEEAREVLEETSPDQHLV